MYIFAYFMFSDAVSTISQMTTIITGEITSFSAVQITLQSLVTAITSIIGCLFFLWISKRFQVKTKTNLLVIVVTTALVPVWGCFGISMTNFGIKVRKKQDVIKKWIIHMIHIDPVGIMDLCSMVRLFHSTHLGMAANNACRTDTQRQGKPILWFIRYCKQSIIVSQIQVSFIQLC